MIRFSAILKLMHRFFPSVLISSFLGIGKLPAWQCYWASFFSLLICFITFYLTGGLSPIINEQQGGVLNVVNTSLAFAVMNFKIALMLIILGFISISIVRSAGSDSDNDAVVIQIAIGQILFTCVSMPAIIAIYVTIVHRYIDELCYSIVQCAGWITSSLHLTTYFAIPYTFFVVVDSFKFWPIVRLQLGYNNAIAALLEGFVSLFYASLLAYAVAFMFADLTAVQTLVFTKYLMQAIFQ